MLQILKFHVFFYLVKVGNDNSKIQIVFMQTILIGCILQNNLYLYIFYIFILFPGVVTSPQLSRFLFIGPTVKYRPKLNFSSKKLQISKFYRVFGLQK